MALAWESQSTRRVECWLAARQAARFTAVVVLPTPPFWFATAIIRAKSSPERNLAKAGQGCKMFHVEHRLAVEIRLRCRDCSMWNILPPPKRANKPALQLRKVSAAGGDPPAAQFISAVTMKNDRVDLFHVERIQLTSARRSPKTVSRHNGTSEA